MCQLQEEKNYCKLNLQSIFKTKPLLNLVLQETLFSFIFGISRSRFIFFLIPSAERPLMESLVLCFLLLLLPNYSYSSRKIQGVVLRGKKGVFSKAFDPTRVIQLSWQPRAFFMRESLSDEECDHLINLGKGKLEKSMVIDDVTGLGTPSEERTSSGMFLSYAQDEVVTDIEDRNAAWTLLPKENGENLQILRYEQGQKHEPHYDYFFDKYNQELAGNRVATVLMYLSNVKKGGETVFPQSQESLSQEKDDTGSDCAKKGYAVKPRKGDALLFFNLDPDGTPNPRSEHESCPVIGGEKWSATRWIHVKPLATRTKGCVDENERCVWWAKQVIVTRTLITWWVPLIHLAIAEKVVKCVRKFVTG